MRRALALGMVLAFGALLVFTVSVNLLEFGTFPERPLPASMRIEDVLSYENTTKGVIAEAIRENRVQIFVGNWGENNFSIFYRENDNVGAGYKKLTHLENRVYLIELSWGSIGQGIIENAFRQTRAANVVASVVWGYRGYDTLGEVTVLFAAVVGVLMVFRGRRRGE